MSHRAVQIISMSVNLLGELTIKHRENIVKRQGVSAEMDPARVGSENSEGLSGPETIRLAPVSNIGNVLAHVLVEGVHVDSPGESASLSVDVLLKDRGPFLASNSLVNSLVNLSLVHLGNFDSFSMLDVRVELLVSLVILVIKRSSFELNNTSEAFKIGISSSGSNFSTETVTSNSSSGDLVGVHETDDILSHFLHVVRIVVIRESLVAVIKAPDVADLSDFVIAAIKELSKVLCGFNNFGKPNHSGQVLSLSFNVGSTKFYRRSVSDFSSFCILFVNTD